MKKEGQSLQRDRW